jgi:hypothetical protein
MPSTGPQLPPHLAEKRKRDGSADSDDSGPAPARTPGSTGSNGGEKRRRVIGPTLPPAPIDERPPNPPGDDEQSDSEDEFGPAAPPAPGSAEREADPQQTRAYEANFEVEEPVKKPQREAWMLAPPTSEDWSSRVDPTKLRARRFNTGKGARAPAERAGPDATWTETLEEKRKRLEDEVMGAGQPGPQNQSSYRNKRSEDEDRETERRINEYNVSKHFSLPSPKRGPTVYPGEEPQGVALRAAQKIRPEGGG